MSHPCVLHYPPYVNRSEFLQCPKCGGVQSKVVTSRPATFRRVKGYGRKRKCHKCDHEFRTIEVVVNDS